jgi:hypothetical protein
MPLRQRLEIIADQIDLICTFIKSVSFRFLELVAWLIILFIVGKAAWAGL